MDNITTIINYIFKNYKISFDVRNIIHEDNVFMIRGKNDTNNSINFSLVCEYLPLGKDIFLFNEEQLNENVSRVCENQNK